MEEGIIKFNFEHKVLDISLLDFIARNQEKIEKLKLVRNKLHEMNLVGVLENGIAFGNLSVRLGNDERNIFLITGSATGGKAQLNLEDFALVDSFSIDRNFITSLGQVHASSESLTHAAIYQANKEVMAVIHVHNKIMFDSLTDGNIHSISKDIPYGSPQLAYALGDRASQSSSGIVATKGHEDGVFAWGLEIGDVLDLLLTI